MAKSHELKVAHENTEQEILEIIEGQFSFFKTKKEFTLDITEEESGKIYDITGEYVTKITLTFVTLKRFDVKIECSNSTVGAVIYFAIKLSCKKNLKSAQFLE